MGSTQSGRLAGGHASALILGILTSAIVGVFVIAFFLQYLRRHSLSVFVWYRVIFGIILVALVIFRKGG